MKKIWDYFNGKKTVIAAALLVTATFLSTLLGDTLGYQSAWLDSITELLRWIGMVLGGVGLGHKAVK
jgi:hypothetical protein